jgi:hypothetical protein
MRLNDPITKILKEWWLDSQSIRVKRGIELPHYRLIKQALFRPSELSYRKLADYLQGELESQLGVVPHQGTSMHDTYSRDVMGFEFSIIEEQHQLYWLLRQANFDT